jgi:MFS family permease
MNNIKARDKNFYYGWVIVFMAGLTVFFSGPGQTYSVSIFIDSYIRDFGWSRSLVSSMYSIATLAAGTMLFLIGKSIDKHGHRIMSVFIPGVLGAACMWNSFAVKPWMLFAGFFLLRLFGQGSMTLCASTLVPKWFINKRALAISLMSLGGVFGSAVLPVANTWLIDKWDWPFAWRFWAVALWAVYIPMALIFIKNKPEKNDVEPERRQKMKGSQRIKLDAEVSWTLREAMRTRSFWLLMFCTTIPSMIVTGVTFHIVSIMAGKGLDNTFAAITLSAFALTGFPTTFLAGVALDKLKSNQVVGGVFILQAISLVVLFFAGTPAMAVLFGVIAGASNGTMLVCNNVIWANYYGIEHLGSIRGFSMTSVIIGSAFGPLPFGMAYDLLGSYNEIILLMMIFPLLGFMAAMASPKPVKK